MIREILKQKKYIYIALGVVAFLIYVYAAHPPRHFPSQTIISVPEGSGLYELSIELEKTHVIGSPFWFRTAAIILGGERGMKAGQYFLPYPQSTFTMAWRIFHGDYRTKRVKLTILEGYTNEQISAIFDERFPLFNHGEFLSRAEQGFLFPDTYFFSEDATASSTIALMNRNFHDKVDPLMPSIEASGHTLEEIMTMASIIEAESGPGEERNVISGILWKRIKNGIALQVDAAPETYDERGLPEHPINNPGIASIKAAINPTSSAYFYYLHDKTGSIHYARTFDEHKANKVKYLN